MDTLPELIAQYGTLHVLDGNECYVKEGQIAKTIGWVESGMLRSFQIDYQGEEVTTNLFLTGSFCGAYYSFYEQKPSFEYIQAMGPVRLKTIEFHALNELYDCRPEINRIGRKLIEQVCIQKDIRIAKMLQLNAKQRYQWFLESYGEVVNTVQLRFIASYLGMKPETLSRIRRELIS